MRHDALYVVAAFSPDGRLLVSGCGYDMTNDDPSVRVWELASGREVRRFDGHRAGIYSVAFFPDGHRIATASADATAMVWDVARPNRPPGAAPPPPLDLDRLWTDLAGDDAARAYRAIWDLVAALERVVLFLADRLKPVTWDDPDKDTSLGPIAKGEMLRRLRAIAVLEKIGTPESRLPLERLASGLEGARAKPATPRRRCDGWVPGGTEPFSPTLRACEPAVRGGETYVALTGDDLIGQG